MNLVYFLGKKVAFVFERWLRILWRYAEENDFLEYILVVLFTLVIFSLFTFECKIIYFYLIHYYYCIKSNVARY